MPSFEPLHILNGQAAALKDIPSVPPEDFRRATLDCVAEGARVCALFGCPAAGGRTRLYMLLAHPRQGQIAVFSSEAGPSYPALTPDCPQVHLFERELAEDYGILPEGHPWLKPVRFPHRENGAPRPAEIGMIDFYRTEGEQVHEVAVGPVHAGIIEPGHFRFQASGEEVLHLEISLGYQHRGVERALAGGPDKRTVHYMETLAGDTTVGHATAYAQVMESLGGKNPGFRAQTLRAVALELERMANHAGDLGALAGDIGYLPTASFCGRLRGDILNLTALVSGSRFGRGWIRPGGVGFDIDWATRDRLLERLEKIVRDLTGAVDLLWNTPSVLARFEGAGALTAAQAVELGLVGPAARACGLSRDVRFELPSGKYRFSQIPVATWSSGDVFARAWVRWQEILNSAEFIRAELESLQPEEILTAIPGPAPESLAAVLVEAWRGEICHVAMTGADGRFSRYKAVDPSFHNWAGLAQALRGQQISDFPLCNKSFNLSYCGHDL
ncbi:NADH-quinone oxidoreductase subunit C [bacterium]|nr:NADH-quinone oxidoreductase subunit C [bacterium]